MPSREESDEAIGCDEWYFCSHPFFFISSPENNTCSSRHDKCEPYQEGVLYATILWDSIDDTGEPDNHQRWCDELSHEEFPYTFHCFLHLGIRHFLFSVMNPHPELAPDRSEPYCTEHPDHRGDRCYSNPVERDIHRKKDRKIKIRGILHISGDFPR